MRWYRTFLALLVAAATVSFPGMAQADTGSCPTPAGSYGSGNGSLGSPFEISTPAHLQRLRDDSPSWGSVFVVTASIDMTVSGSTCTWESSIGQVGTPFSGIFYGNGHEIVDLDIAPPVGSVVVAGLFGVIANATLDGIDFSGNVTATARADHQPVARAGGIVGLADGASMITNSSSAGTVIAVADDSVAPGVANASAGGLVGLADSITSITGGYSSASATSTVWADDSLPVLAQGISDAGGLVGTISGTAEINASSATGNTRANVRERVAGSGSVEANAGGLVGSSLGNVYRSVAGGAAIADASPTDFGLANAGGLMGRVRPNANVSDSYATGAVTSLGGGLNDAMAGGLVGLLDTGGAVATSYATGQPTGTAGYMGLTYVGGLIGRNNGTITNSVSSTAQGAWPTGNSANTGTTWATPAQMQDIATYQALTWNIGNVWNPNTTWLMCTGVNSDYPFLASQYTSDPGCSSGPGPGPSPDPAPEPAPELSTAPRDVTAEAGDGSASVSWSAPASSGSFPVTHYLAISTPGEHTCLVAAPALTCDVRGLTNGTAYTFAVKALTGAGWSASSEPSNSVVPRAKAAPSIVIMGTREGKRIEVSGSTTGFGMGAILNPWVRLAGQSAYTQGSAQVLVSMDGTFRWGRTTGKKASVYMETPDGSVRSNAVTIR